MPINRPTALLVIACSYMLAGFTPAQQAIVSRSPPETYRAEIAPMLTPLDEAIALARDLPPDPGFGGTVIVNELVHRVEESGARLVAIHSIYRADSEAGAESLAREQRSFRSATQKIHLALAQTISPDGTRTPVRDNATLIRSPQRGADQSLYSDAQELVIIFPKVKPGTLTESIIVIDEASMRVPGEFMTSATWASGWPTALKRVLLDLPAGLADRLRFSPLGTGAPTPRRSIPAPGRVRFELANTRTPGYLYEIGRPPISQSGPATWITTLANWDAFADWYRPLLKERSTLSAELAELVDTWTAGVADEDEIIARLLQRASNDVRYTGLEFGISGLQPYDCNEVWENQYGDCKDKSNLLRAMLAHKGIRSYLTLLNTEHAGRIEKRSPDYRQFDHAILAIEREGGSLQFCDPTIEFARPGSLSPDDADREVLVIRDDRAEFVRTPAASAGRLDYDFDLELSAGREISGWLTLSASGNYANSYRSFFSRKDPQALNQALAGIIGDFFPTAEVADVETPKSGDWNRGDYQLRAYFVAPGNDKGKLSLLFPQSDSLFPNLGETKIRHSPYYGVADQVSVDARFRIPARFGTAQPPRPFSVDSSAISSEASWELGDDTNGCRARLEIQVKKPLLSAEEFQVAFAAVSSIRSWLAAPLIFDPSSAPGGLADADSGEVENFPLMPSAAGQLSLLDRRFPSDGNLAKRRAALAKVLQFFPNDLKTSFLVESHLAEIDWNEGDNRAAIDRLLKALNSAASDAVGDEEIAWAEYILAFCYRDQGDTQRAREIFKEIADNAEVSDFRRGWAGYQRLSILKREPAPDFRKLAAETNALIDFDMEARAFLVALHAEFMTRSGQAAALEPRLVELVENDPSDLPEIVELLCAIARELPNEGAEQLTGIIRRLPIEEGKPAAETLEKELAALEDFRTASASYAAIQQRLRGFIDENEPDGWEEYPDDTATLAEKLEALEDSEAPSSYLPLVTSYLLQSPPGERFPFYLWRMAAWCEFAESSGQSPFAMPALPFLLDLCDSLPKSDSYYLEGRFLRAKSLAGEGEFAAESAIYLDLLESGQLSSDAFVIAATSRLATSLEAQGKLREARDYQLRLQDYSARYPAANDALLNAMLISLELGDRDRAAAILDQLSATPDDILTLTPNSRQIRSMTALSDPMAYWAAGDRWWPEWETLYTQLVPGVETGQARVPAIGELPQFGAGLRNAVRAQDSASFYSQFDLLLRALRWSPEFFNDCGSTASFLATAISPDSAGDLRKFVITLCEEFTDPSAENLRQRQLYQALALLDTDRPAEALPISQAFFKGDPVEDPIYYSMVRIWAIAASRVDGADLDAPAGMLEEILASNGNDESRLQNVVQLARLYRQLKRAEKEEALLARELEHSAIRSDEAAAAQLRARYQALARDGTGAKDLTDAIAAWLADHGPAWLTSCEPLDLAEPRVGDDLEKALEEAGSRFSEEEAIKLSVLAAGSDRLGLRDREQAFASAFQQLLSDAATHRQARAMITAVLEHDGFPKTLKQIVLFSGLDDALAFRRPDDIAFLLAHPSLDRDNERLVELAELYQGLSEVDFDSGPDLSAVIADFTGDRLKSIELRVVIQCFNRLLELGDLAAAEAVYKASGNWELDPDLHASNSAIKLGFLKILKNARQTIPLNDKLAATLAPMLELDQVTEPGWFDQRRHLSETADLSIVEAIALRLYQARTRRFDQTNPLFWFDVADAIQGPDSSEFAFKLLEVYLAGTADDAARSRAAFLTPGIVDTDKPSVRERLKVIFDPYRDLANAPLTRDAIRIFELQSGRIRSGEAIDIDAEFSGMNHPAAARIHTRAKLTQLIQREDKAELKQYLDRLPADRLLDGDLLDLTIPALEMAGLDDEAELARDTATEMIPALIAHGWRLPESNALSVAYYFSVLLDSPSLVPPAALEQLLEHGLKNERRRLNLMMLRSRAEADWPSLETAADEAIRRFPTFYAFYLEKARALYHQGRKREAAAPLRTFLKFCADDVEFTKAKRWLSEAEE